MTNIRIIFIELIEFALLEEQNSVVVVLLDVPELFLKGSLAHHHQCQCVGSRRGKADHLLEILIWDLECSWVIILMTDAITVGIFHISQEFKHVLVRLRF